MFSVGTRNFINVSVFLQALTNGSVSPGQFFSSKKTEPYQGRLFHQGFKVHVTLSRHIKRGEQISDQAHEDRYVIRDNLRDVKVTQCTHKHLIFRTFPIASLQRPSDDQHRFDGTETPVIMVL